MTEQSHASGRKPQRIFVALFDETTAAQTCEQIDDTDGRNPDDGIGIRIAYHECGDEGAVAGVVAFSDDTTVMEVILEGQDTTDSEDDLPTSIVESLDRG